MKTLVIIPTYNEYDNILALIAAINEIAPDVEILVVDDGSPDGTANLVRNRVHLLERSRKSGIGPAYVAGFRWALSHGFENVVQMDADFSHRPKDLPLLLSQARRCDLVIGSRWIDGGATINWPWSRRLVSRVGSWYSSLILGLPVRDVTSGFRAYSSDLLAKINLDEIASTGYAFQIEMTLIAKEAQARIVEVPITFVERVKGRSKMSLVIAIEAFSRVTFWGLRRLAIFSTKKS